MLSCVVLRQRLLVVVWLSTYVCGRDLQAEHVGQYSFQAMPLCTPFTVLSCDSCSAEHRLDPVAADAASAILPVWMAAEQQQQQQQPGAAVESPTHQPSPAAAPPTGSEASAGSGEAAGATQRDLRAAAEAAAGALQRAGIPARLMQLSFGDFIVVFDRRGSSAGSSRRPGEGSQAAVVPAPAHLGRASINAPHRLVGSALVACRVLAARGVAAVPHTGGEVELLAACAEVRQP